MTTTKTTQQNLITPPKVPILVSGSRKVDDPRLVERVLRNALGIWGVDLGKARLLHGQSPAGGVDAHVEAFCRREGVASTPYPVTNRRDKSAYHVRNAQMASVAEYGIFILFDGPHSERLDPFERWNRGTYSTWTKFKAKRSAEYWSVWVIHCVSGRVRMWVEGRDHWIF